MRQIEEYHQYIAPDGKVYDLSVASRKGRWVMQSSGWGMPPIEYITQRGAFQHGETVKDYFLQPRVIQLLINQSFCDRQGLWDGRASLLDAVRPNRQLTETGIQPGTLRRILPDGTKRDIKVFVAEGPAFDPDVSGWREHSFKEVLRFIAHDPVIYDPALQSYEEDFDGLAGSFRGSVTPYNNSLEVYYTGTAWAASSKPPLQEFVRLGLGYQSATHYKGGGVIRVPNVSIPNGVTISAARVELYATDTLNANTVNARITGNKELTPGTFSTLSNYQTRRGTVVGGEDNSRITTAQVDWDGIAAITQGGKYNTPDIKTIIQELIDMPGRSVNDALALFIDDHDGRSTASDGVYRRFLGVSEFAPGSRAQLYVEYVMSGIIPITYSGNWLTYPRILITGPLDSIEVENQATREKIGIDYNIPAGRTVILDLAYGVKTVYDNLGTNLIGTVTPESDLATFHIAPDPEAPNGLNFISVVGSGIESGQTKVRIEFYNRYIGI